MKIRSFPVAAAGLSLVAGALVATAAPASAADEPVPCEGFPGSISSPQSGFGETDYHDEGYQQIYPASDSGFVKPGDYLHAEIFLWWEQPPGILDWRRDGVPTGVHGISYQVTDADRGHRIDAVRTEREAGGGYPQPCIFTSKSVPVGIAPTTTTLSVNRTSYQYGDGNSIVATVRTSSAAGVVPGRVVVYRDWNDYEWADADRHVPIATFRNDGKAHQVRLWATYGREETRTRPQWSMAPRIEARFVPDDVVAYQYSGQEITLRMTARSPRVKLAMKKRVVARKSRAVARVSLDLPVGPRTAGTVVLKSRGKVIGSRKVSASGRTTVTVRTKRLYERGRRAIRAYWTPATVDVKGSAKGYSVKRVIRIR